MNKIKEMLSKATTKEDWQEVSDYAKTRLKEIEEQEFPETCCVILQDAINDIRDEQIIRESIVFNLNKSHPTSYIKYDKYGARAIVKGIKRVEINIAYDMKE